MVTLQFNATPVREHKGKSLIETIDNYVVLDLETTGLDPQYDTIIEIGIVRIRQGDIVDRFQTLVNPGFSIDPFITELTGITNEMLSCAPSLRETLPVAIDFMGNDIVVAHNANFDVNFIYESCCDLNLQPFTNNFIDTMRLSRRLFPEFPHHRLSDLVQRFEIADTVEHRAIKDATQTYGCYEHLKHYVTENNIDLIALLRRSASSQTAKDIITDKTEFDESSPVFGKQFVFTGTLEKMVRKEAMQLVVDLGGSCGDGVTKKTNFLVLGNNDYCSTIKDGKSSKQKKAEKLRLSGCDIEIISENVFYDMIAQSDISNKEMCE